MSVTEPGAAHKRVVSATSGASTGSAHRARWQSAAALSLLALVFALQSVALHRGYAARVGSAADFQPRWYATRALLFDGRDPYSPAVTAEIEAIRDPNGGHDFSYSFAYPLHLVFLYLPLAYVSYDWAQAIWTGVLLWVALGITLSMLALLRWRPTVAALGALTLGTVFFYPVARSIILGQFTLHVTLFIVLALLLIQHGRPGWAGVALAATSVKPQMVILILPWFLIWAIWRRERRLLAGLFIGGLILLAGSLLLYPRWPLSFWEDVGRYADLVSGGRYPLEVLFRATAGTTPLPAMLAAGGLLVVGMLRAWVRALRRPAAGHFDLALFWAIAAGLLIPFQTGSTNQALLLIPFLTWLRRAPVLRHPLATVGFTAITLVLPWALFLSTIRGDEEHPLLALPLPLLGLALLLLEEWRLDRAPAGVANAAPETSPATAAD